MTWYTGDTTYDTILVCALAFVALVAISAPFVDTPYGRFASTRFGVAFDPRLGWFLMELPSSVVFLVFYFRGPHRFEAAPLALLVLWCVHYANRGFFFPFSIRTPRGGKASFSLFVVATGWFVTILHGYLNGSFISTFGTHFTREWLTDPRFVCGVLLWATSFGLNLRCDSTLRNLRTRAEVESGEKVYRVPRGELFELVSSPSYLTELGAWAGFALATWSLGGVFIFAVSAANLVPRALATHRWYKQRFADYPAQRKALIPFVL